MSYSYGESQFYQEGNTEGTGWFKDPDTPDETNPFAGRATTWGPSHRDDDGSVTGVRGAYYQLGSNGSIRTISEPPRPSQAQPNINISNPASSPAAISRYTDSQGNIHERNELTGSDNIIGQASVRQGGPGDNGYNPATGLPWGVFKDSQSRSGFTFEGKAVNADGSIYTGDWQPGTAGYQKPDANGPPVRDFADGTTRQYNTATGKWDIVASKTPSYSTSGGGGSSTSSGGGGGSSGGGGGTTSHQGGYTNTDIRQGGYTNVNQNLADPAEVALGYARLNETSGQSALDRALQAAQQEILRRNSQVNNAATFSDLAGRADPNAYAAFRYGLGDNTLRSPESMQYTMRNGAPSILTDRILQPAADALSALRGGDTAGGLSADGGLGTAPVYAPPPDIGYGTNPADLIKAAGSAVPPSAAPGIGGMGGGGWLSNLFPTPTGVPPGEDPEAYKMRLAMGPPPAPVTDTPEQVNARTWTDYVQSQQPQPERHDFQGWERGQRSRVLALAEAHNAYLNNIQTNSRPGGAAANPYQNAPGNTSSGAAWGTAPVAAPRPMGSGIGPGMVVDYGNDTRPHVAAAGGYNNVVDQPTDFTVGEAGPEAVTVKPLGNGMAGKYGLNQDTSGGLGPTFVHPRPPGGPTGWMGPPATLTSVDTAGPTDYGLKGGFTQNTAPVSGGFGSIIKGGTTYPPVPAGGLPNIIGNPAPGAAGSPLPLRGPGAGYDNTPPTFSGGATVPGTVGLTGFGAAPTTQNGALAMGAFQPGATQFAVPVGQTPGSPLAPADRVLSAGAGAASSGFGPQYPPLGGFGGFGNATTDEIRKLRGGALFPNISPYDAAFANLDPVTQAIILQGWQEKTGIPKEAIDADRQRMMLGGVNRSPLRRVLEMKY